MGAWSPSRSMLRSRRVPHTACLKTICEYGKERILLSLQHIIIAWEGVLVHCHRRTLARTVLHCGAPCTTILLDAKRHDDVRMAHLICWREGVWLFPSNAFGHGFNAVGDHRFFLLFNLFFNRFLSSIPSQS